MSTAKPKYQFSSSVLSSCVSCRWQMSLSCSIDILLPCKSCTAYKTLIKLLFSNRCIWAQAIQESQFLNACQSRGFILKGRTFILMGSAAAGFKVPLTNERKYWVVISISGSNEQTKEQTVSLFFGENEKPNLKLFPGFSFCVQNRKIKQLRFCSACVFYHQDTDWINVPWSRGYDLSVNF